MILIFLSAAPAGAVHEIPPCEPNPAQAARLNGCQAAVDAMSQLTRIFIRDTPKKADVLRHSDVARAYVSACFENLSETRSETVEFVGRVSGTLILHRNNRAEPFCSGFRLAQSLVATAAHCGKDIGEDDRVTFRLYGSPNSDIELDLTNAVVVGDDSDDATDFMVAPMVGQLPGELPPPAPAASFRAEPPSAVCESFQPILIAGHSQIAWWLDAREDLSRWYETVMVDRGTGCQLQPAPAQSAQHCLAYRCQTLPGMSGAPIYGYDYKTHERVIIGIHLRGGAVSDNRTCGRSDFFNIGIRLPFQILELIEGAEE